MKFKTTAKAIRNGGGEIICAGYCELQHLLHGHEPIAYTCGIYGWNFDVYSVYGLTICTGYRGMPGRRPNNPAEYETRARRIWEDRSKKWEERESEIESLLREFCEQA